MINENFKPVEHKFVETPYAEMLKHGMMQQANYDEAVGAMAEYDAKLGALKRVDEDTYQKVMSKYDQDFRDMYDQSGGDWGAMKNRVKQRLGAETANPYYNLNRAHVEAYDKLQEDNRQRAMHGQQQLTFSEMPLSLTDKNGKLINIKDIKSDIETKLEWDKAQEEAINFSLQEEESGWAESIKGLNKVNYKDIFLDRASGTSKEINETQVLNKIDGMYKLFMESNEGKQKFKALMNSKEFKMNNATPQDVEFKMKQDLLDMARLKIHKSTTINRSTISNPNYGRSGGGGSEEVVKFADLPSGLDDKQLNLPTNTFGRFLQYANEAQAEKSKIEKELVDLDKEINAYKRGPVQTVATRKALNKALDKKTKALENMDKIEKAIQFHRKSALESFPAVKKLSKMLGFNLNSKDPKSVNEFFKIPGVVNAFNDLTTDRKSYIGKRIPVNNKKFEEGIDGFIRGEKNAFVNDKGEPQTVTIDPKEKLSYEFVSGSNQIRVKSSGPTNGYIINRTKLPTAVTKELKAMDRLMLMIHDPAIREQIEIGGNRFRPIDGVDIIQKIQLTSDGSQINPLEVYFAGEDGGVYSASTLYSSGFTTLETAGGITHGAKDVDMGQFYPNYPK
jgi:hypothetical protein